MFAYAGVEKEILTTLIPRVQSSGPHWETKLCKVKKSFDDFDSRDHWPYRFYGTKGIISTEIKDCFSPSAWSTNMAVITSCENHLSRTFLD